MAFQRRRVFGAQLEDMADFDAAAECEHALAIRAGVTVDDVAKIGDLRGFGQITTEVDAGQVEILFIGTTDEVVHGGDTAVGDHRYSSINFNGTDIAGFAMQGVEDFFLGGETERAEQLLGFDFI